MGRAFDDFEVARHDLLGGKHGDHIGGEREAARRLIAGAVDAACMIDSNHLLSVNEGTLPSGAARVLTQTAPYDHCNFTALDDAPRDLVNRFRECAGNVLRRSGSQAATRSGRLEGMEAWPRRRL